MSVSGELLCSFELLKPLDSAALKSHIKKGRKERNSLINSPVSGSSLDPFHCAKQTLRVSCDAAEAAVLALERFATPRFAQSLLTHSSLLLFRPKAFRIPGLRANNFLSAICHPSKGSGSSSCGWSVSFAT